MRFERLVQVQAGQALHIKTGEPHGAYEHHPQRIFRVLEFFVQLPLLHFLPVVFDIQTPFLEGLNLVLLLADHHGHFRLLHPGNLPVQLLGFLLGGVSAFRLQLGNFPGPVFLCQVVHPHTGDLVQAHEHSLPAGPQVGVVAHKVPGDGVQPLLSGQQMDFLGKFPLQLLLLVHVQVGPLDGVQNPVGDLRVVEVGDLIPPVLIVQGNRGPVLHRPFEIVH